MRVFFYRLLSLDTQLKFTSFLGYFPVYLSCNTCKFVLFCIVCCLLSRLQHQYAQAATHVSFRTGSRHFEASQLHQQGNTNRCEQYTLQSLFFYYLPITNNKSKNIILLSLKLSEIAQSNFQLLLFPSTRPHVNYPSSLLLKYYNIGAGNQKVLINPVSGKRILPIIV